MYNVLELQLVSRRLWGWGAYQGSLGREYHACGEDGEGMKILEKKIKIQKKIPLEVVEPEQCLHEGDDQV